MDNVRMIVVGVDGSEDSEAALRFALEEAVLRRARVRVVRAFYPPESLAIWQGLVEPPPTDVVAARLEDLTRKTVEAVTGEPEAVADVPVEVQAIEGEPGKVLVDQARDADLLVIGHRGRGAFASFTLGSVGLRCVLHAPCPVTIVPSASREAAAG